MSTTTLTRERLLPSRFSNFFRPWEEWFDNRSSIFDGEFNLLSVPAANITEDKQSYQLSLAAPGMEKKDFNVDIEGDILTISAEREVTKEEKEERYSRKEYNFSSFTRSFTLPAEVIKDKIDASYVNGILNITIPKTETAKKSATKRLVVK